MATDHGVKQRYERDFQRGRELCEMQFHVSVKLTYQVRNEEANAQVGAPELIAGAGLIFHSVAVTAVPDELQCADLVDTFLISPLILSLT
ncbi:hypothetical protein E4U34_000861 [Claviceps purpurea]|nr:hypothetical protein E4U34_000861 [Claviceps purpurea]